MPTLSLRTLVTLAVIALDVVTGHPQCLDFRPPFEVSTPLEFCTEYAAYGCCNRQMDDVIRQQYNVDVRNMGLEQHPEVADFYKTLLCQRWSPYAAHVYDAEDEPSNMRVWPGLCTSYCHDLYDAIGVIAPAVDDATRDRFPPILQTAFTGSRDDFCSAFAITDTVYCYPELKTNDRLNGDIDRDMITADGCLCLEPFAENLRNPLSFETPPDLSGRVFVSEQVGVVHIYYKNGTKRAEPFMDISNNVFVTSSSGDERGFLGLEFHPDFENNGRVFVFYSFDDAGRFNTRISEFTVSGSDPNLVDYTSERVILDLPQPFANHNGGEVINCCSRPNFYNFIKLLGHTSGHICVHLDRMMVICCSCFSVTMMVTCTCSLATVAREVIH